MRRWLWQLALVTTAVLVLSACSSNGRQAGLWAFDGGAVSADGMSVELDVYGIPDPSCVEFDRIESEMDGDELVVSLYYLGPEEGQFCNIPCPLGTTRQSFALDTERAPGSTVAKNPETAQHCSESLASGG